MHLLLTNDDGIDAPGLATLTTIAASLGKTTTIAPAREHSGCSHQVTTHSAISIEERDANSYALHGTPVDCVRVGMAVLCSQVDWVLSGINSGGNLGADIHISGTVAAVREAVLHGKQGIAISHYRRQKRPIDWERAFGWVAPLLADLIKQPLPEGQFWNINLPDPEDSKIPDVIFCPLDINPLPASFEKKAEGFVYSGNYHQRKMRPGSDVAVCFEGNIAVSRISLL